MPQKIFYLYKGKIVLNELFANNDRSIRENLSTFISNNGSIGEMLFGFVSNVVDAIITIIIATLLVKATNFFIKKIVINPSIYFIGNERKINTLDFILNWSVKYVIYFIAVMTILLRFGIPGQSILAVASLGSVAIGLAAQVLVRDFMSGVFILMEDQLTYGDVVKIGDIEGTVETLGLRTTSIRSADGKLNIISNSEIRVVTNMSRDYKRAMLKIKILYENNMDTIVKVLNDTLDKFSKLSTGLLTEPKILGLSEMGEDYVTITISVDCKVEEDPFKIESDMRKFIKESLDKAGITIRTI